MILLSGYRDEKGQPLEIKGRDAETLCELIIRIHLCQVNKIKWKDMINMNIVIGIILFLLGFIIGVFIKNIIIRIVNINKRIKDQNK